MAKGVSQTDPTDLSNLSVEPSSDINVEFNSSLTPDAISSPNISAAPDATPRETTDASNLGVTPQTTEVTVAVNSAVPEELVSPLPTRGPRPVIARGTGRPRRGAPAGRPTSAAGVEAANTVIPSVTSEETPAAQISAPASQPPPRLLLAVRPPPLTPATPTPSLTPTAISVDTPTNLLSNRVAQEAQLREMMKASIAKNKAPVQTPSPVVGSEAGNPQPGRPSRGQGRGTSAQSAGRGASSNPATGPQVGGRGSNLAGAARGLTITGRGRGGGTTSNATGAVSTAGRGVGILGRGRGRGNPAASTTTNEGV
ncbi:hypothetical protein M427DRAFT_429860 [Gonapodya prolifera JEL478]|uniref:Uncharacterized protein n=1 Tax=Gonapodya prolifera (strain JEL478) TaxID=1344416 RepID=A0A139ASR2_GONPJ|nr:hypothetical protein M427DRAFT_429860 [Gonapodya prolifera JEL478]|eukprot:KXS19781.1 hypothetical protein M427DRAFT_429860 [Gonapodya prolifera JEL478]